MTRVVVASYRTNEASALDIKHALQADVAGIWDVLNTCEDKAHDRIPKFSTAGYASDGSERPQGFLYSVHLVFVHALHYITTEVLTSTRYTSVIDLTDGASLADYEDCRQSCVSRPRMVDANLH